MKKCIATAVLIAAIFSLFTGCVGKKTAITKDAFTKYCEGEGYAISDATSQFEEGAVNSVTLASKDSFQIEFYVLPSAEQAVSAFEQNKNTLSQKDEAGSIKQFTSTDQYSAFTLQTKSGYYLVKRVENTFVFVDTDAANKQEVDKIIEKMGY